MDLSRIARRIASIRLAWPKAPKGGWKGEAEFDFEVEWIKSGVDGQYYNDKDPALPEEANYNYETIPLKISGSGYYTPPRGGDPSDDELYLESVIGPDGKDYRDKLSKDEMEGVMEMLQEKCQGEEGFDEEGWDDRDAPDSGYDRQVEGPMDY